MNILNKSIDELKQALETDFKNGLTKEGLRQNTEAFGKNIPYDSSKFSYSYFIKSLLSDVMLWVFFVMTILAFNLQNDMSAVVCFFLFAIYIALRIGIFAYIKKVDAEIDEFRKISVRVIRDGKPKTINSKWLVPGDIMLLKIGDILPCDCLVISENDFEVYETFITGERLPIKKKSQLDIIQHIDPYHTCILFSGSAVARGSAKVLVCHTGKNIFDLNNSAIKRVSTSEKPKIYSNNLFIGKQLSLLWILMCFVVFVFGVSLKHDIFNIFFISVTLSVAAIGDSIPLLSELAMMSNISRLYKKFGCVIKNYPAIDRLNLTNTVFLENFNYFLSSMPKIKTIYLNNNFYAPESAPPTDSQVLLKHCVSAMTPLTKDSSLIDISLSKYLASQGITKQKLHSEYITLSRLKNDVDAVLTYYSGEYLIIVKGFADCVLEKCTNIQINNLTREIGRNERFTLLNHIHNMSIDAQTIIAVAKKSVKFTEENADYLADTEHLTFIGFIGFYNPINTEAVRALSICRKSDIGVILMENASPGIYLDLAKSISILQEQEDELFINSNELSQIDKGLFIAQLKKYRIFSMLTPEQRLYVTENYKKAGDIITCIPDGITDIPVQSDADASITTLNEEVPAIYHFSDVIFKKRDFTSFTELVKHSRAVYHNARRMLMFILSNQFIVCTLILAGMIFEKVLILNPALLFFYGIFSIFPCAVAISCENPPQKVALVPPDFSKLIFNFLSLIPPPLIIGLCGGISTVFVHRIYCKDSLIATSACIICLFTGTFLVGLSLRSNGFLFSKNLITPLFFVALAISIIALVLIFNIPPLALLLGVSSPRVGVTVVSILFGIIPLIASEIVKKAKNFTK